MKYRANCTSTGSLRPSDCRISARWAADVSIETIWFTGSPAKRNIENAMMPTASMTPIAWSTRRRVKASISTFHCFSDLARRCATGKRQVPEAWASGTCFARRSFTLFGGPIEQDLVVRALGQLDLVRDAPGQRLLVQGNVTVFLDDDIVGLLDQLVALGGVGLDQRLVGQRIDLAVAIAAEIGLAAGGILRIVAAAEDIVQHVVRV